jgi:Lon-like ATP-dependent protease
MIIVRSWPYRSRGDLCSLVSSILFDTHDCRVQKADSLTPQSFSFVRTAGFYKAVTITSPAVIAAIKKLQKEKQPYIGAFVLKEDSDQDTITSPDQVYPVGVFAQITSVFGSATAEGGKGEQGGKESLTAVLYPHRRIRIDELLTTPPKEEEASKKEIEVQPEDEVLQDRQGEEAEVASFEKASDVPSIEQVERELHPRLNQVVGNKGEGQVGTGRPPSQIEFLHEKVPEVSLVNISNLELEPFDKDDQTIKAIMNEIISVFKDIAGLAPFFREQITSFTMAQNSSAVFDDPAKLADFAAAASSGDIADLQQVLESLSVPDRLQKALMILKKELINAQTQTKITKDVETKLHKRQREVYLMEQLKGIKKELGMDSDGKDKLVERFKEKASKLSMPDGVKTVFDEELNKLMHLEPAASEFK